MHRQVDQEQPVEIIRPPSAAGSRIEHVRVERAERRLDFLPRCRVFRTARFAAHCEPRIRDPVANVTLPPRIAPTKWRRLPGDESERPAAIRQAGNLGPWRGVVRVELDLPAQSVEIAEEEGGEVLVRGLVGIGGSLYRVD